MQSEKKNQKIGSTNTEMNDALRRKYEELCELRLKGTVSDVDTKYKIAAIVKEIKADSVEHDGRKYGARSVECLAKALSVDKSLLYKEAKIAEVWSLREVKKLAGSRDDGLVSWTHLIKLAEVTNVPKRTAALKAVVSQGLTVAALHKHLHPPVASEESTTGLSLTISRACAKVEGFGSQFKVVGEELAKSLAAADVNAVGVDDVEQMHKLQQSVHDVMVALTDSFHVVRGVLEKIGPSTTPPTDETQASALE